jgi:hypothetical protein
VASVAGVIFAALVGTIYTAAAADRAGEVEPVRVVSVTSPALATELAPAAPVEPAIPAGHDVPEELAAVLAAERDGEILDPKTGLRIGPFTMGPVAEPERGPRARVTRRDPPPPPLRLHSDPGRNVVMVARHMNATGVAINGSCYRYISEVFERAGHTGWRTRRVVYQGNRNGPYANPSQIRTGDWLYIVNHPEATPVGTHSVLFVSWYDRGRGLANVIEHPGWGAATTGRERTYDVSRTYRITRPIRGR